MALPRLRLDLGLRTAAPAILALLLAASASAAADPNDDIGSIRLRSESAVRGPPAGAEKPGAYLLGVCERLAWGRIDLRSIELGTARSAADVATEPLRHIGRAPSHGGVTATRSVVAADLAPGRAVTNIYGLSDLGRASIGYLTVAVEADCEPATATLVPGLQAPRPVYDDAHEYIAGIGWRS